MTTDKSSMQNPTTSEERIIKYIQRAYAMLPITIAQWNGGGKQISSEKDLTAETVVGIAQMLMLGDYLKENPI